MAPHAENIEIPNNVAENLPKNENKKSLLSWKGPFLTPIIWRYAIVLFLYNLTAIYVLFTFPYLQHYRTTIFAMICNFFAGLGVTAGIHRHYTHKSYKVTTPLNILLLILYGMAGQHTVKRWVRDHRVHHKCSDTLGDPYNSRRGSFFSQIGWLVLEKHPEFQKHAKHVNLDDIINDPYIRFFDKHFLLIAGFLTIGIPILVPMYFWNETLFYAFQMAILRHVINLNVTFTINGFAHLYGKQTYNKNHQARQNSFLTFITNGEGSHNFHHSFPYDYRSTEKGQFNITTLFIEFFAKLGWAYDFKEARPESVKALMTKFGSK